MLPVSILTFICERKIILFSFSIKVTYKNKIKSISQWITVMPQQLLMNVYPWVIQQKAKLALIMSYSDQWVVNSDLGF